MGLKKACSEKLWCLRVELSEVLHALLNLGLGSLNFLRTNSKCHMNVSGLLVPRF